MRFLRNSENSAVIVDEMGAELATLTASRRDDPGFAALAAQMEAWVSGQARILVMYRDGLLEEVRADTACEVLLVEEDRYEQPPIALRRRPLAANRAGVDKAMELIEAQIAATQARPA